MHFMSRQSSSSERLLVKSKKKIFLQLERGIAQLSTHEQLCKYLWSYGKMHQAKLLDAFKKVPEDWFSSPIEVIDWGCGQAMGTINSLGSPVKECGLPGVHRRGVVLVEPSAEGDRARGTLRAP